MEQDHRRENGSKDGNTAKSKPVNGRAGGNMGPGLAMKLPGKPQKNPLAQKKGRPGNNKNANSSKENLSTATLNLPNGGPHFTKNREGRRQQKDGNNRLSPAPTQNNGKSRSRGNSRNNSASPVERMDGGDPAAKKADNSTTDTVTSAANSEQELTDVEVTTKNLKQLLQLGNPKRIVYSRIQLLNISENPSSKNRPECLEEDFNASNGRWDPETWHRSLSSPPPAQTPGEKVRKFSFSAENRDRFPDDVGQGTGGIILGPQRRSFQDGCHVTSSASSRLGSKHHLGSPTETGRHAPRPRLVLRQRSEVGSDYETSNTPNRGRQIESASAGRTEEFDWDRRSDSRFRERDLSDLRPESGTRGPRELPRDLHELRNEYNRDHRDGEYRDRDYRERKFSHSRDYNNSSSGGWYQSQPRDRREKKYPPASEPEPEWYTAGPTSQFDTIELAGFEEDTPAAAADFSSWGGGIPMGDPEEGGELEEKQGEELEKGIENGGEDKAIEENQEVEKAPEDGEKSKDAGETTENKETEESEKLSDLDLNELWGIPGFSVVMEQILKESTESALPQEDKISSTNQPQGDSSAQQSSTSSRFSQWFQRDQNLKETNSGGSTPHEELENLAELAAERGLASPVDVESKPKNDIMRLLSKSGGSSPNLRPDVLSLEQQDLARKLLMQQMKSGSVMSVAELEAKAGARHSPSQTYGGVDMQNTPAFNKLVASIREKDKIKQRRQVMAQQQAMNQFQMKQSMSIPGGRIPSPEELAAHTQIIFQQALIKRQLEKQKEAYIEKKRQIEQQRREEQLREAIRSADEKMQKSKQKNNKSLAFMPTSVMRKMHETREGKPQQPDDMMGMQHNMGAEADDLASATASFTAKLANSGKKAGSDVVIPQGNDLLARIYQSASLQQSKSAPNPGLRRNASFPEVDANKRGRASAFHQPARQGIGNSMDLSKLNAAAGDSDPAHLQSLLDMQSGAAGLLNKPKPIKQQAADIYNNNMLKPENQQPQQLDRAENKPEPADMSELKNQQEVALLTQVVLNKFGINEDQLSRLTPQQQQTVVNVIQEQYYHLQVQKQLLLEKKAQKDPSNVMRLKSGELPPPNVPKSELHPGGKKMEQNDQRPMGNPNQLLPKSSASQVPNPGMKFPQQQPVMPGVTAGIPGFLPTSTPQLHPLQLRPLVQPPMQFIPPIARGPPIIPTFLPPQTHIPGRLMPPPPPANVPLGPPLGPQYHAAAMIQMQLYQQQQQRALLAATIQQQQIQAYAAARQQNIKDNRGGELTNPLEQWFSRDALNQSQNSAQLGLNQSLLAAQKPLTLNDIERINSTNQKQE